MTVGDIVTKKSFEHDLMFKITEIIDKDIYVLSGINYRLKIYAFQNEIEPVTISRIKQFKKLFKQELEDKIDLIMQKRNNSDIFKQNEVKPGKVLHVDADIEYLNICMKYYKILGIPCVGENITEKSQPEKISEFLKIHMPDILVITGHDSLRSKKNKDNLDNYQSSAYFIETVKSARWVNPSKDSLIIFAGACQSHYEGLIEAGANIASSPNRILIHALDPVFVVEKISYTPVVKILNINEILENTITGSSGLGGFQVRGTLRQGREK